MDSNSQPLSNKERLELILQGEAPDFPPHFELVFQIAKEMLDMDAEAVKQNYASEKDREDKRKQKKCKCDKRYGVITAKRRESDVADRAYGTDTPFSKEAEIQHGKYHYTKDQFSVSVFQRKVCRN